MMGFVDDVLRVKHYGIAYAQPAHTIILYFYFTVLLTQWHTVCKTYFSKDLSFG